MNRLLPLVTILFVLLGAFFFFDQEKKNALAYSNKSPLSLGSPNEGSSWYQWNQDRLADPSTGEIPRGIRRAELEFAKTLPKNSNRSLGWQLIGPKQLGGRTRAAAFDVRDENIVLAGGTTGGMWKSVDGMASFYKTTNAAQLHSVTCLAQDTRAGKEDIWYAGTGEYYPVTSMAAYNCPFSGDGIYKSTDNGESWSLLASTQSLTPHTSYVNGDMDYVWRIVIDHTETSNDVVLAAVYNGIFRTTDGGTTWNPVLGFDSTFTTTSDYCDVIITPSGIFYAALSSDGPTKGIYRSDDGINWTNILPSTGFPGSYGRWVMTYNPLNENEVMFLGNTTGSGLNDHSLFKYTYLSGTGAGTGGTWENRSANLPNGSCTGYFSFDFGYFQTQGGYDMCIAYHPTNDSILFIGGTNLYRSTDAFASDTSTAWIGGYKCTPSNPFDYVYDNHHPDQHGLIFFPSNPNKGFSFNDGGLFVTNDILAPAVTWNIMNNNYITSQFYTVTMEQGNASSDFLVGGAQDNGTWFTNSNHLDSLWKWIFRGDGSFAAIPEGRPYYLLSIQQGKIYKVNVNNNGDTSMATRVDPNITNTINFINPFILDPNDHRRVYMIQNYKVMRNDIMDQIVQTGEIYDTVAHGWSTVNSSTVTGTTGYISSIEMSKAGPNTLYFGTSKGKVYKVYNAHLPTASKISITSTLFPTNAYVSSISVSPFDSSQVIITFSNYKVKSIFYSNDAGATFTDVSGNLEQFSDGTGNGPAVYWAEVYPSWPSPTVFVGTSIGLYSTNNLNGSSTIWSQEGPATIGNVNVNMIESRPYDGKIVVATHGNGFYSASLAPAFASVESAANQGILAVYPNPTSQFVTIDLPSGPTDVKIFTMTGKQVYSKSVVGGIAKVNIPVKDFSYSPGTYLVVVSSGGQIKKSKLVVR